LHSAILLALAYVLGPAAVVLTGRGRRSGMLVGVAMVCAAGALAVGGGWWSYARGEVPAVLLPLMVLAGGLVVAAAATVWSRSLHLLLTSGRFPVRPWPNWLQNPWCGLVAGLVAPGSGMALARRPRLAALTAWWTWPGVAAVLVLAQAPLVWRNREAFARWGLRSENLEYALVLAVVVAVVAAVFWLSQALAGARLLAIRAGRWQNARGDWTGLGLAGAALVCAVVLQPGALATDLADYAAAMAEADYRVIPLALNRAARGLDPGQMAYALQEADLHAARGDEAAARQTRAELERRIRPYLGLLAAGPQRTEPARRPVPVAVAPRAAGLPTPLVHPAGGDAPAPPAARPSPVAARTPAMTSAALLFGPGMVLGEDTENAVTATGDSLP
jgi:hypothetical protein